MFCKPYEEHEKNPNCQSYLRRQKQEKERRYAVKVEWTEEEAKNDDFFRLWRFRMKARN